MNYQVVPISKLKQDPSQPRKFFDQDALNSMAVSIKNEGIINPIEVDKNYVIVTGERRYRASKIAGLTEVPVKILPDMSEKDRFIRQVQENIHQNTMSAWDTAVALEKCRQLIIKSTPGIKPLKKAGRANEFWREGIAELNELFGMPKRIIEENLFVLGETGEVKKALQTPGFQSTKILLLRSGGGVPPEFIDKMRHLIVTQPTLPRDTIRHLAVALNRAKKYGELDKAEKLFEQDYRGLSHIQALNTMNKIVLDEESRLKGPADASRFISQSVINMIEALEKHPLDSFDPVHRKMVEKDLNALGFYVGGYLQGRDMGEEQVSKTKLLS